MTLTVCVYIAARNRSTVGHELALRPGVSTQARMPPTARSAPRGGRRGLLVLTAGLVRTSTGVTPPARWSRPYLIERAGVLAPFLPRGPNGGTGRPKTDDEHGTEHGSAQARRAQSRSWIAAPLAGGRCPTTSQLAARGSHPDQSRPAWSKRSPPRVPDEIVRLARRTDVAFSTNEGADMPRVEVLTEVSGREPEAMRTEHAPSQTLANEHVADQAC